jgi:hypothetical protein
MMTLRISIAQAKYAIIFSILFNSSLAFSNDKLSECSTALVATSTTQPSNVSNTTFISVLTKALDENVLTLDELKLWIERGELINPIQNLKARTFAYHKALQNILQNESLDSKILFSAAYVLLEKFEIKAEAKEITSVAQAQVFDPEVISINKSIEPILLNARVEINKKGFFTILTREHTTVYVLILIDASNGQIIDKKDIKDIYFNQPYYPHESNPIPQVVEINKQELGIMIGNKVFIYKFLTPQIPTPEFILLQQQEQYLNDPSHKRLVIPYPTMGLLNPTASDAILFVCTPDAGIFLIDLKSKSFRAVHLDLTIHGQRLTLQAATTSNNDSQLSFYVSASATYILKYSLDSKTDLSEPLRPTHEQGHCLPPGSIGVMSTSHLDNKKAKYQYSIYQGTLMEMARPSLYHDYSEPAYFFLFNETLNTFKKISFSGYKKCMANFIKAPDSQDTYLNVLALPNSEGAPILNKIYKIVTDQNNEDKLHEIMDLHTTDLITLFTNSLLFLVSDRPILFIEFTSQDVLSLQLPERITKKLRYAELLVNNEQEKVFRLFVDEEKSYFVRFDNNTRELIISQNIPHDPRHLVRPPIVDHSNNFVLYAGNKQFAIVRLRTVPLSTDTRM